MQETKKYSLILFVLLVGLMFLPKTQNQGQVGGAFFGPENKFPISEDRGAAIPQAKSGISEPQLSARAALAKNPDYDIVLLQKDTENKLPIASLTKLMTALVVIKKADFDEVVEVSLEDTIVIPNVAGLRAGEKITVANLMKAMLIGSANDAALALARHVGGDREGFVKMMNDQAALLGMENTSFINPVGFDAEGQYSTISDLERMVRHFLDYPELLEIAGEEETTIRSVDGAHTHRLLNTNRLLPLHEEVVGIKTGYTEDAKGNLILLIRDGKINYYAIILGSDNREQDGEHIINWIGESFEWK